MKSRGKGVQSGLSDIRTIAYSDNCGLVPTLSLYPIYIVFNANISTTYSFSSKMFRIEFGMLDLLI